MGNQINVELPVEHVSDTAWWVAELRAQESERPDSHFKDPLAKKLVGDRGKLLMEKLGPEFRSEFLLTIRTKVIDDLILNLIEDGVETVVNLAAGLDTRPYRLKLPPHLRWIEADYPALTKYKNETLVDEEPRCDLERVGIDLADDKARRAFLAQVGEESLKALVLTEGLLYYLTEQNVIALANELHEQSAIAWWMMDFMTPSLMDWMKERLAGKATPGKTTSLRFVPEQKSDFYEAYGWKSVAFHSFLEEGKGSTAFRRRAGPLPPTKRWANPAFRF